MTKPQDQPNFELAAGEYAAAGIATFPLGGDDGKIPLVKGSQNFRANTALKIAARHPTANIGFWCGAPSNLTIIDIDTPGEAALDHAKAIFGPSPIVVRTGSGMHHIYYRGAGERRLIRPFAGLEIDVLGTGGYCVAPPSIRPGGGSYMFTMCGLSALGSLPTIRPGVLDELLRLRRQPSETPQPASSVALPAPPGAILEGDRNQSLFRLGCQLGHDAETVEILSAALLKVNGAKCHPPLSEVEVRNIAKSIWKLKVADKLWEPGQQYLQLNVATIDPLFQSGDANALMLYVRLQKAHAGRPGTFAASPKAMAAHHVISDWAPLTYQHALSRLCGIRAIERVKRGGGGPRDPALYRWPDRRRVSSRHSIYSSSLPRLSPPIKVPQSSEAQANNQLDKDGDADAPVN